MVYSCEPDGVCEVRMSDPDEADLVVQMMDRRYFGKRMLSAEIWDGKTKFKLKETEDETKERLSKWDEFLEQDDEQSAKNVACAGADTKTTVDITTPADSTAAAASAATPVESVNETITPAAATAEHETEQKD